MHDAFAEISGSADVLLLCGDLTDYGLPEEAEELAADIRSAVRIPCIGVIGNHDYESGKPETVADILDQTGVTMLNGEARRNRSCWIRGDLRVRRGFRPADAERVGRAAD